MSNKAAIACIKAEKECSGYELQKECAYIALVCTLGTMAYNTNKAQYERRSDLKYLMQMREIFQKEGDKDSLHKVNKIIATHP